MFEILPYEPTLIPYKCELTMNLRKTRSKILPGEGTSIRGGAGPTENTADGEKSFIANTTVVLYIGELRPVD